MKIEKKKNQSGIFVCFVRFSSWKVEENQIFKKIRILFAPER